MRFDDFDGCFLDSVDVIKIVSIFLNCCTMNPEMGSPAFNLGFVNNPFGQIMGGSIVGGYALINYYLVGSVSKADGLLCIQAFKHCRELLCRTESDMLR